MSVSSLNPDPESGSEPRLTMQRFRVDDLPLAYEAQGEGEPT